MSTQSCRSPDVLDPAGLRVWSVVGRVERVVHGLAGEPAVNLFPGKPAGHAPPARFPDGGVLVLLTHRRRIA